MRQSHENLISDRRSYRITADCNKVYDIKMNTLSPCVYRGLTHDICSVLGDLCNACGNQNHWSAVCRYRRHNAKIIQAISMGIRVSSDNTRDTVFTSLYIHNDDIVIKAKVGTGAKTNVLPYNIFVTLKNTPPPQMVLAYGNVEIKIHGITTIQCISNNISYNIQFYIAYTNIYAIVGLPTSR